MLYFAKTLAAGAAVLLTAALGGYVFIFRVLEGPSVIQSVAFAYGLIIACIGSVGFIALYHLTQTASAAIGAISGAILTVALLSLFPGSTTAIGFAAFCGVGATIGGVSALCGALALRCARLPVRRSFRS